MSKDKDDMSTAVTTSPPEESRGKTAPEAPKSNGYAVHKPGEGYATRLGLFVVVLAYVTFAARQWFYNWVFIPKFLKSLGLGFIQDITDSHQKGMQITGTVLVAAAGLLAGYYYIYIRRDTSEFLIRTDTELGKVTWPKVSPWFRPETQVWGATYVVLIVIAALTLYVLGVDTILQTIANAVFFK